MSAFLLVLGAVTTAGRGEAATGAPEPGGTLRPPAVPLVTHDPYFSIWSASDNLADSFPRHWTGKTNGLCGMARIDGQTYRFMGTPNAPDNLPAMEQTALSVLPTRTLYTFAAGGVDLDVTFLTPALPDDLDILSRPVTYIVFAARASDGKPHAVSVYLDAAAEIAVNTPDQPVAWSRFRVAGQEVMRVGSQEQPILQKKGDDLRIDWGYLYLSVPSGAGVSTAMGSDGRVRGRFAREGALPAEDDMRAPRPAGDAWPVLACAQDLGSVGAQPVERHVLLAYDDIYSLEFFERRLRPYWRRTGWDATDLLRAAERDYPSLRARCERFDAELTKDLTNVGGPGYAALASLAYRQCLAAHKLAADWDGTPIFMSKENFSNGCIDTMDVTYPSAPFFLLLNPELLAAQLRPVLAYASSPRWRFPFAPHDLGTYPKANGQVYGGGEVSEENQMPVEESGNVLLLVAAHARATGRADLARAYWPTLTRWAEYLRKAGLDPENQLCTDDFAGHLAHNANLSVKAILALAAYGQLAGDLGEKDTAATYHEAAKKMAKDWMRMADDGDHYRLAFDKPGTWSQKYNLVWDNLLNLGIFPPEVARKEIAFYTTKLQPYGLPLDSRRTYTKADWEIWTATLTENPKDFQALVAPVVAFVSATPDRVPFTDWYETTNAHHVGFQARSVVGGVYIPLLKDPALWSKWVRRAEPGAATVTGKE